MSETRVNVVGVGNTLMGDDGVGPAAIERLAQRGVPPCAQLCDAGIAIADVLCDLNPSDPLIVIDAMRGSGPPGSVYVIQLDPTEDPIEPEGTMLSLHELSVVPALRLEALTGRIFSDVTVFGVEPAVVRWGETLSDPVRAALDRVVDGILEEVDARKRKARSAAPATATAVRIGPNERNGTKTE